MKNFNIVVFGCSGMLGSDLMELIKYEENVHVRGYTHKECDISDSRDMNDILEGTDGSITHVINCSGLSNLETCEDDPSLAFKVNSDATRILSELCLKEQIHLTHISTDYIFEGLKNQPYLEQDEAIPLCIFGKSKLNGEGFVKAMGGKGLIIRTSSLYGKFGKNTIDTILNKLELAVPVKVVSDLRNSPTYTMDLANIIIQLSLNNKSGIYNVVNSGSCSHYEFALKAAEYMNYNKNLLIPISYLSLMSRVDRPKYSVLSTLRLQQTFKEPIRKWEDALYQYLIESKRIYDF